MEKETLCPTCEYHTDIFKEDMCKSCYIDYLETEQQHLLGLLEKVDKQLEELSN